MFEYEDETWQEKVAEFFKDIFYYPPKRWYRNVRYEIPERITNFFKWGWRMRYACDWSADYAIYTAMYHHLKDVLKVIDDDRSPLEWTTLDDQVRPMREAIEILARLLDIKERNTNWDVRMAEDREEDKFKFVKVKDGWSSLERKSGKDLSLMCKQQGEIEQAEKDRLHHLLKAHLSRWWV